MDTHLGKTEHDEELHQQIFVFHKLCWDKLLAAFETQPDHVKQQADLDITFLTSVIRFIFDAHVNSGREITKATALDVFDNIMERFEPDVVVMTMDEFLDSITSESETKQ